MKLSAAIILLTSLSMIGMAYATPWDINKHIARCSDTDQAYICKLKAADAINLMQTTGKYNVKNVFLEISQYVAGELRLYQTKEHGEHVIKGQFVLDNFSDDNFFIQYHVIFKDKKGAVAQTKGDLNLGYGQRQKLRFSTIVLSEQDIKNITSYEVKVVASDRALHRK